MRRAQLVTPFGVGAMSVQVDGTSVITAGLDYWFKDDQKHNLDIGEFESHDWRLESRLNVSRFRLPPDYRTRSNGDQTQNVDITVPVLRFPRWCFCMYCKRLELSELSDSSSVRCPNSSHKGSKYAPRMSQVPFVTICRSGHLDDFPFDKWVHRAEYPSCRGTLRLKSRGGSGLEGQRVVCEGCGTTRSLQGITGSHSENGVEVTHLSKNLTSSEEPFLCTGARPWLGELEGKCQQPMRGALRAAGNVYFPKIESSIYIPRREGAVSDQMHQILSLGAVAAVMDSFYETDGNHPDVSELRNRLLRRSPPEIFDSISDEELLAGYMEHISGIGQDAKQSTESTEEKLSSNDEWRYPEFSHIRDKYVDDLLTVGNPGIGESMVGLFDRVRSVDTLQETRTLRGFTRVQDGILELNEGKRQLRRRMLPEGRDWLPAYVVKGEGIYLELDAEKLDAWESKPTVIDRVNLIAKHYEKAASSQGLPERVITARFVLLHTLSHLLMNQLVYSCGYSSASLRERLYVSSAEESPMFGLLIYTAAGDSEGTMGGLVRMARPDILPGILKMAVSNARWCSTDPVCMDSGDKGQGPNSCNLAACHGCALVPETSCEEFNRFLDRGLVVGTFDNPDLGFFSDIW